MAWWDSLFSSGSTPGIAGQNYQMVMPQTSGTPNFGVASELGQYSGQQGPGYLSQLANYYGGGGGGGVGSQAGQGGVQQYYQQGKGTGKGQSQDPTGEAILAPTREARARVMGLMPEVAGIGSSIHPQTGAMTGAAASERARLEGTTLNQNLSAINDKLRKNWALGNTVQQGIGLIKDLVTDYYTGGGAGMGGGGGMGGMGGSLGGMLGGMARSYMSGG
jgi:hypothetical protein